MHANEPRATCAEVTASKITERSKTTRRIVVDWLLLVVLLCGIEAEPIQMEEERKREEERE